MVGIASTDGGCGGGASDGGGSTGDDGGIGDGSLGEGVGEACSMVIFS